MPVSSASPAVRNALSPLPSLIPNQIGGLDAGAVDGRTFSKVDPATGQPFAANDDAADSPRAEAAPGAAEQVAD